MSDRRKPSRVRDWDSAARSWLSWEPRSKQCSDFWKTEKGRQEVTGLEPWCSLNVNDPCRLINFFQVWWNWLGRIGCMTFGRSRSLCAGFEVSKVSPLPVCSFCLLVVDQDVSSRLFLQPGLRLAEIVNPNKYVILQIALAMVFYHSNMKVAKTSPGGRMVPGNTLI